MPLLSSLIPLIWMENPVNYIELETSTNSASSELIEGFCQLDPTTISQLVVPISVPRTAYTKIKTSTDPLIHRISYLLLVGFYFLLWVGE